jgi:hypothetical protein
MKKLMMGAVVAVSMVMTGCTNVCGDLESAAEALETKVKPCLEPGQTFESFNVNQCEDSLDNCSDSEKEALSDYADCIRKMPECTPATEQGFVNALAACSLTADGKIGASCAQTLGVD